MVQGNEAKGVIMSKPFDIYSLSAADRTQVEILRDRYNYLAAQKFDMEDAIFEMTVEMLELDEKRTNFFKPNKYDMD